jgi:uncharacterized protein YegJ (DUF2314 family)
MSFLHAPAARRLLCVLLLSLPPLAHAAEPSTPAAGSPFPSAQLHSSEIFYTVLLLHPTAPQGNVVAEARTLLATKYKELNGAWKPDAPRPEVMVEAVPSEQLDPVDEEQLRYFGENVEPGDFKRLMGARHATALSFHVPFAQRFEALLAATRFAHQLATQHGALLWDVETREYFSPKRWKEKRLDGWSGGVPRVVPHITLHVYSDGEGMRIISLGMVKFGLPDLVVEQVQRALVSDMGTLVNAVAQLLAEGLPLSTGAVLQVDLARVKDSRMQKELQEDTKAGVSRKAKLQAVVARRDEGDPDNPLLELSFPGKGTPHARQLATLEALFGKKPDNVAEAEKDDPELAEVARKARARLAELRPLVEKGLRPPARLLVKAGFRTDDGNVEHMWLEVTGWSKDRLRGTLANEPHHVRDLHLGSSVDVPLSEVGDYLYTSPEGKREGGESSQILLRRQGR